jgi:hypothetical protein
VFGGLDAKWNLFIARGLSEAAAGTCIATKIKRTQRAYQSSSNHFCTWCCQGGFDPNTTSVVIIVDYLQDNLDQGKKFSTVKSRVSAINYFHSGSTFRGSLGTQELVPTFLAGANRLCADSNDRIPTWDLPTVLQGLMAHPFEPFGSFVHRKPYFEDCVPGGGLLSLPNWGITGIELSPSLLCYRFGGHVMNSLWVFAEGSFFGEHIEEN